MGAEPQRLHVLFLPLMAAGHMIPTLDIAKLFSSRHIKTTIVTTPLNAPTFIKPLERYKPIGPSIDVEIIPFPSKESGLAEGVENFENFTSNEMSSKFLKAAQLLEEPLEQLVEKYKPNCIVADMLLPFATRVAAKCNIPRLVFHGTNLLSQCATDSFIKYEPHKSVSSNDEEFVIPNLPHEIRMTKSRLFENMREGKENELMELFIQALEAEAKSFGVIVNTFHELEPEFAEYYRNVMGRKAWTIGPVSLCNAETDAKFQRGKVSSIDEHECLNWLDSKEDSSVIYICFGSLSMVSPQAAHEIATALEASGVDFIWVIRRQSKDDSKESEDIDEWLPNGFEKRMYGKGLIIRGWAPQVLILDHHAIGAFMTHCGWNSTLEGISCGVPMVTWPVFAEQFYNEKLVTDILKTGIGVGAKNWNRTVEADVKWESIKEAIVKVMQSEEGLEMRERAMKLKEIARKAVDEGGSSHSQLSSLIDELKSYNVK